MRAVTQFFVRYGVYADVVVLLITVAGLVSFTQIRLSFFPEIVPREIIVEVVFPGASPEEMEEGVVLKVEEAIQGIQGIDEYTSVARENNATITIKAEFGADPSTITQDVKNAVDEISSFPEGAEKPIVFHQKQAQDAIEMVLTTESSRLWLEQEADRVRDKLLSIDGISIIDDDGLPPTEIAVTMRESALQRYNMTLEDVALAVLGNNQDITGGVVKGKQEELRIRSRHRSAREDSIANIVLQARPDGSLLRVRDVADVKLQFEDSPERILFNGKEAVSMKVFKTVNEDMIFITDTIKNFAAQYNREQHAARAHIISDRSVSLNQRIDILMSNGFFGLALVLVALGLFLNLRLAWWVAFGIPIAFMGMFLLINLAGFTINQLSLFGMILVVGILVDDGIVIAENIYTKFERGLAPVPAAVNGTLEVLPSVFASVTTTMVAFTPFFFIRTRIGDFVTEMGGTVIAALAISLVEASLILPAHVVHFNALRRNEKRSRYRKAVEGGINFLRMKLYAPLLKRMIRYKYISLSVVVLIVLVIIGMFRGGLIQQTFFPNIENDETNIYLSLQPGTPKETTLQVMEGLSKHVWAVSEELTEANNEPKPLVESTRLEVGTSEKEQGANTATMKIQLLAGEFRETPLSEFENNLNERIGDIPNAQQWSISSRAPFGKPVSVSLVGTDLNELKAARDLFIGALEDFDKLKNIVDNEVKGMREVELELKPKAYMLGLTRAEVALQVRRGFFGREVQRIMVGKDEVKIWVRYPESGRRSLGELGRMRIRTPEGGSYELDEIATYRFVRGIQQINRFNGGREIRVEASLKNPDTPVPPINERIRQDIIPPILKQFKTIRISFEGQAKENRRFQNDMGFYMPVALFLMFLIVTLVFRSFVQTFIIFLMIPFGLFFAMLGHFIEGLPLSLLSIFGIIALSGIIINDGVVFIDRMNRNLRVGMPFGGALYSAGLSRFRPILLTSITTVVGLYPIVLEQSRQAQFLRPMAVSVAYGVLFVTVVILMILPIILSLTNDIRVGLLWFWNGTRPSTTSVEPAYREGRKRAGESQPAAGSDHPPASGLPPSAAAGPMDEDINE